MKSRVIALRALASPYRRIALSSMPSLDIDTLLLLQRSEVAFDTRWTFDPNGLECSEDVGDIRGVLYIIGTTLAAGLDGLYAVWQLFVQVGGDIIPKSVVLASKKLVEGRFITSTAAVMTRVTTREDEPLATGVLATWEMSIMVVDISSSSSSRSGSATELAADIYQSV